MSREWVLYIVLPFLDADALLRVMRVNRKAASHGQGPLFTQMSRAITPINVCSLIESAPADFIVSNFEKFDAHVVLLDQAAYFGRLDILRAMTIICPEVFMCAMTNACMKNHLDVVKWMHEDQGISLTKQCWIAFEYGARDVVSYIHDQKCPFDPNSIAQACCSGRLEMLKWLWNHRKLDMLKHRNDVARGIDFAASRSDRTLITWLHARGFSGHEPIWHAKLSKQSEAFIAWLRSCGYKQ